MGKSKKSRSSRGVEEAISSTSKHGDGQDNASAVNATMDDASPPAASTAAAAGEEAARAAADDFDALYLRRVTAEFADDLETLRQARDFDEASVPLLVHALRAGAGLYSPDERTRLAAAFRRTEEVEEGASKGKK